jgi:hypothetical protein
MVYTEQIGGIHGLLLERENALPDCKQPDEGAGWSNQ